MITAVELFMLIFTQLYYLKQRDYEPNLEPYLACSTLCSVPPAEAQETWHGR